MRIGIINDLKKGRYIMMLSGKIQCMLVVLAAMTLSGCALLTGKGVLPGRAEGLASINVQGRTLEEVANAIHSVFAADGFQLKKNTPRRKLYERSASRMKDFSYGGLTSQGMVERAYIDIHDLQYGNFRIECNVFMAEKNGDPFFDSMGKVLKLFGGQYRALLRRVERRLD